MRALLTILVGSLGAAILPAQDAKVSILHGVPGLSGPVEIVANGNTLFSFAYGDQRGPLELAAGNYALEVRLNGNAILAANATLTNGDDVSVIAHLDANGSPMLSAFANDASQVAGAEGRVIIRHLAAAPAVDVVITTPASPTPTVVPALVNGNEVTTTLPLGTYEVALNAAGTSTTVFGPVNFRPQQNVLYEFIAVGDFSANSFGVEVLQRDLTPAVPASIQTQIGGWSCGPTISAAPAAFDYGEPFDLVVSGAPANAMAIVNFGDSITSIGTLPLPLPLSLQSLGAPGCFVNANAVATLGTMTDAQGELRIGYLVPRAFAGGFLGYFQVGVLSNANALGVVTTEYLEID